MSVRPSIDALAAALLTSHGFTQKQIAERFGREQPTISRLISIAEKAGYLRRETRWVPGDLDEKALREVRVRAGQERLTEALERIAARVPGLPIPKVAVFPSSSRRDSKSAYRERLRYLGREAGPELVRILTRARVCGVCWGQSVSAAVAGIELAVTRPPGRSRPVTFIPITGEQVGINPPRVSASMLASRLAEIWNGDRKRAKSLLGVPAFIPSEDGTTEADTMWKYVWGIRAYEQVFGQGPSEPGRRLIDQMDTVLVSVGVPGLIWGTGYGRELQKMAGIDPKRLNDLTAADIGGALVPKPTLSRAEKKEVAAVSSRWTGIQLDQLSACAKAAHADPTRPGVVVIAIGANKAEMVRRVVVEHQLVNHLLLDEDLEERLLTLLGNPSESSRAA